MRASSRSHPNLPQGCGAEKSGGRIPSSPPGRQPQQTPHEGVEHQMMASHGNPVGPDRGGNIDIHVRGGKFALCGHVLKIDRGNKSADTLSAVKAERPHFRAVEERCAESPIIWVDNGYMTPK